MSISNYAENKLLDTLRGTAFSVSNAYLKLHTGDPGEDAPGSQLAKKKIENYISHTYIK